ncbi:MAG: hypothetical protein J7L07_07905 [Candidatus Odinarchaeota archaeon]|nr:hypothetical protein [Candidatus Odinarchaeota archaeon]
MQKYLSLALKVYLTLFAIISLIIIAFPNVNILSQYYPLFEFISILAIGIILDPIEHIYQVDDTVSKVLNVSLLIIFYYAGASMLSDVLSLSTEPNLEIEIAYLVNLIFLLVVLGPVAFLIVKRATGSLEQYIIKLTQGYYETRKSMKIREDVIKYAFSLMRQKGYHILYILEISHKLLIPVFMTLLIAFYILSVNVIVSLYTSMNELVGLAISTLPLLVEGYRVVKKRFTGKEPSEIVLPIEEETVVHLARLRLVNVVLIVLFIIYNLMLTLPVYAYFGLILFVAAIYVITTPSALALFIARPLVAISFAVTLPFELIANILFLYSVLYFIHVLVKHRKEEKVSARFIGIKRYFIIIMLILFVDTFSSAMFSDFPFLKYFSTILPEWIYMALSLFGFFVIFKMLKYSRKYKEMPYKTFINEFVLIMILLSIPGNLELAGMLWVTTHSFDIIFAIIIVPFAFLLILALIAKFFSLIFSKKEYTHVILTIIPIILTVYWIWGALNSDTLLANTLLVPIVTDIIVILSVYALLVMNSQKYYNDLILAVPMAKEILNYFLLNPVPASTKDIATTLGQNIDKISFSLEYLTFMDLLKAVSENEAQKYYLPQKERKQVRLILAN